MVFPQPADRTARKKGRGERGSAIVEFSLCAVVWVPLLLGVTVFGIDLVRSIQVSQLSRDTGHMYAYGIDFSQPQNSALIASLASPLGIKSTSGNGAVLLSTVTLVTQIDCDNANLKICANTGSYVFTSLYAFGNKQFAVSQLGTPNTKFYGTPISAQQYMTDGSLVAKNFSTLLPLPHGQYAYISEVTVDTQAIVWQDFSKTGSYARSIF